MIKFWSIFRNTFTQTIRQPVFGILILVTFALLVLDVPLSGYAIQTMTEDYHQTNQRMLEDLGLSTLLMLPGLMVAAFSASSVLAREIEDRTALTVISKPVSRATFVVGKFAGVSAAVALAFYLCSLVFLMTVRHKVMPAAGDTFDWPVIVLGCSALALSVMVSLAANYMFGWPFTSAGIWSATVLLSAAMAVLGFVAKGWTIQPFGLGVRPDLLANVGLIFMAALVLSAVAVAASTRLGQVMTLLICLAVFAVGTIHPFLFGYWGKSVPALKYLGWLFPKLPYAYPPETGSLDTAIPGDYVAYAVVYYLAYTAAVVAVGVGLFQTRQLESQATASSVPGAVNALAWAMRCAAVVAAGAAAILLSLPAYWTAKGLLVISALGGLAVATWLFAGLFGRGAPWAWWVVVILASAALLVRVLTVALPEPMSFLGLSPALDRAGLWLAVSSAVILCLVLPRSRRHFRRRPAAGQRASVQAA